jgi:protein-S-isoprenylcysteine O-methyltransferase Ste14
MFPFGDRAMHLSFGLLIEATWLAWVLYWVWSARGAKPAAREAGLAQQLAYRIPVMLGFALLIALGHGADHPWLYRQVPSAAAWAPPLGWLLVLAGLGFACWARVALGRNWSATVQIKRDHELVVAGPYRRVRHPIYTGMLLGVLGTILAIGAWPGWLALVLVGIGFWLKLRHEERLMREQFGAAYVAYMQRTKALIPGVL